MFYSRGYGVLVGDSLCLHSAQNACTTLSRHSHCTEGAVTSQRTPYNFHANATNDHGVYTTTLVRAHGAPCIVGDHIKLYFRRSKAANSGAGG